MHTPESDDQFEARIQREFDELPSAERDRLEGLWLEFASAHRGASEYARSLMRRLGLPDRAIGETLWPGWKTAARYMCISDEQFGKMTPRELAQVLELELTRGGEHPTSGAPGGGKVLVHEKPRMPSGNVADREQRLQAFLSLEHRTITQVRNAARVAKPNMQQWRRGELSDDSVMSKRIEAVLSGKTKI